MLIDVIHQVRKYNSYCPSIMYKFLYYGCSSVSTNRKLRAPKLKHFVYQAME